ncbi:MAG: CPBP family intramembrane metalloprotease [Streptococcus sp.]|nr:CPBP family intramembrane metalloprotease [Streptococcus sp.]
MFLSRMLQNVKQSRYIPPIILSILIAIGFVYLTEIIGGILLGFLGVIAYFIFMTASGQEITIEGNYQFDSSQFSNQIFFLFLELSLFIFVALGVFIWVKWVEKRKFSSIGFFKKDWLKNLSKGFFVGVLLFTIVVTLLLVMGIGTLQLSNDLSIEILATIIALIPFWLLQGGTEELVTRGWLFPMVSAKSNLLIGMLLSSTLFGAFHLFNAGVTVLSILNIILYGMFACFYMLKTDNMWSLAGVHGAWNFVQGNIYGIQVSGHNTGFTLFQYTNHSQLDWLSGGEFGAEGSVITSFVLIVGIIYLYWNLKKDGKLNKSVLFSKTI